MNCTTARQYIQLDLDGELTAQHRKALQEHFATCDSCREIRQQSSLIQSSLHKLAGRSETQQAAAASIDFGYRRSISWRAGLAAAAVIGLCVGGWLWADFLQTEPPQPTLIVHKQTEPAPRDTVDPRSLVRVEFNPASNVIAVPIETKNPNVTIIWVYPTVKTVEAPRDPATLPPPSS